MIFVDPRDRQPSDDLSLYRDLQNAPRRYERLAGDLDVDACIIGAGNTGLMTAKYLLEQGLSVAILERHRIGWGASGRCAGFLIPGFNRDVRVIADKFGLDVATTAYNATLIAMNEMQHRIVQEKIPCDYTPGTIIAACSSYGLNDLKDYTGFLSAHCGHDFPMHGREETAALMGTDAYEGMAIDNKGGRFSPLAYLTHLAGRIADAGGRVFEESPALAVEWDARGVLVKTPYGDVRAKKLILSGDAYQGWLVPQLRRKYILLRTSMLATSVLPHELYDRILPASMAVYEWKTTLNYYTKTQDGRLIFGGGDAALSRSETERNKHFRYLQKSMGKLFPELNESYVSHYWSGYISTNILQLPYIGSLDDRVFYAGGYAGHGIVPSHMAARCIADAIAGDGRMMDVMRKLDGGEVPGAGRFDNEMAKLGLAYYKFMDSLH